MQLNFKSGLHLCKHPLRAIFNGREFLLYYRTDFVMFRGYLPRERFFQHFSTIILGLKGKVEECNVKKVAFETLFFEKTRAENILLQKYNRGTSCILPFYLLGAWH